MTQRAQGWQPDTHDVAFIVLIDDEAPDADPTCVQAAKGNAGITGCPPWECASGVICNAEVTGDLVLTGEDAASLHALVQAENRVKNGAFAMICDGLPGTSRRQVTIDGLPVWRDETGMRWAGENGGPYVCVDSDDSAPTGALSPEEEIIDLFRPTWDFGEVDGIVSFTVPGVTNELKGTLRAALLAEFGDAAVIV